MEAVGTDLQFWWLWQEPIWLPLDRTHKLVGEIQMELFSCLDLQFFASVLLYRGFLIRPNTGYGIIDTSTTVRIQARNDVCWPPKPAG